MEVAKQATNNLIACTGGEHKRTVVEKSAAIKFDKHVASRVFSPDELENPDSYIRKYRKYGIVELLDNKLDGVRVCTGGVSDGGARRRHRCGPGG